MQAVTSPDESTEIAESRWRFQPMRAPGHQLSEDEIHAQLSKFGYKPELYGIKWRSSGLVEYVFQPWYQELLDMGSIQVLAPAQSYALQRISTCYATDY